MTQGSVTMTTTTTTSSSTWGKRLIFLSHVILTLATHVCNAYTPTSPPISPATSLPNQIYKWRHDQQIRYQTCGDPNSPHAAVLVHGLFVNGDHWRHTLKGLGNAGYRAYALDLWGCGYSSKPPRTSEVAQLINGEIGRFLDEEEVEFVEEMAEEVVEGMVEAASRLQQSNGCKGETTNGGGLGGAGAGVDVESAMMKTVKKKGPSILKDIMLGTPTGGTRKADVDLRHPLRSPYNFYTWGELICDFTRDVVLADRKEQPGRGINRATLICNSIGTISSLQAILDEPDLYDGLFVVNPNFRELHSAEIQFPKLAMPILRRVQSLLRQRGQGLFDALAKPNIVRKILQTPYVVTDAVDDILVSALLDPLLTEGASDVVFDTLSYSAGPLPEQQLSCVDYPKETAPVWIVYGKADPWTPAARVERLKNIDSVKKVIGLEGVGHCPHDEAPELINPILLGFMDEVKTKNVKSDTNGSIEKLGGKKIEEQVDLKTVAEVQK